MTCLQIVRSYSLSKTAFLVWKGGSYYKLWIFFFQKSLEQRGVIACAVGDVVDIDRLGDQPVHADILSRDHIAVSAVSQFLVPRDMTG